MKEMGFNFNFDFDMGLPEEMDYESSDELKKAVEQIIVKLLGNQWPFDKKIPLSVHEVYPDPEEPNTQTLEKRLVALN